MDLWVATGNAGKLAEIKSLLMDLPSESDHKRNCQTTTPRRKRR